MKKTGGWERPSGAPPPPRTKGARENRRRPPAEPLHPMRVPLRFIGSQPH